MADAHTGASVVHVDGASEAARRDVEARRQLGDDSSLRTLVVEAGIKFTIPYVAKIVCGVDDLTTVRSNAAVAMDAVFGLVDASLNSFNAQSEVSRINACESVTETFVLSEPLAACLRIARDVHQLYSCYDVACAPLTALLRSSALAGTTPTSAVVDTVAAYASTEGGFELALDPPKGSHPKSDSAKRAAESFKPTLRKKHPRAALDLGSVSKGYAVDRIIEAFVARGWNDALFEWGGDCRAVGVNHKGVPWHVAIRRPPPLMELVERARQTDSTTGGADAAMCVSPSPGSAPTVCTVPTSSKPNELPATALLLTAMTLKDDAIATSGDYEQVRLVRRGPNFPDALVSTLCDPRTRQLIEPSQTLLSQVTVRCSSAAYADALATAALIHRNVSELKVKFPRRPGVSNVASDYLAYLREDERVTVMHETAHESADMRALRLSQSLPARVVVVGGGLAGQCAAIEAARCGASVVLLEKASRLGGNSAKATSGINACHTVEQGRLGINDDTRYFERDTFLSGVGGTCDIGLVKMVVAKSADAIQWLHEGFGIPLSVLSQLGGHSRPRTHRAPDASDGTPVPIGYTIMQTLERYIRTRLEHSVKILTNAPVTSLLHEEMTQPDGSIRMRVRGVTYRNGEATDDVQLLADAVVLATGGFSSDHSPDSLLAEYAPQLLKVATTNGPFATGDGVKMARAIGAHLVDMSFVQLHPTAFIDPKDPANPTKFLGPEALRGSGGVLMNREGRRFVNELGLRSDVSAAIRAQGVTVKGTDCPVAYCVLNEAAANAFGRGALKFYQEKMGLFQICPDVDALAAAMQCPSAATVRESLEAYERACIAGYCPLTHKSVFPVLLGPRGPFWVAVVTPAIHYTMGGCCISPSAEVQSKTGSEGWLGRRRPIQGLLGAGEVTGGLHGKNRLGGNSLLECVVYGRIAGDRAATMLQRAPYGLSFAAWSTVVLREVREGGLFGVGSRILRFNLPGALQSSGLRLGQFVAIRGMWEGKLLLGYYSPITLPDDVGVVGILARVDKGTLKDWVSSLGPGDAVEMKACGGLSLERDYNNGCLTLNGKSVRRLSMVAGGTGVAPMLQLLRACYKQPFRGGMTALRLIYAAEEEAELSYRDLLMDMATKLKESSTAASDESPQVSLECVFVLNRPPPGWIGEVGFVDLPLLKRVVLPPAEDHLVVLCGPPRMQQIVQAQLLMLGHHADRVRTIDDVQPSHM